MDHSPAPPPPLPPEEPIAGEVPPRRTSKAVVAILVGALLAGAGTAVWLVRSRDEGPRNVSPVALQSGWTDQTLPEDGFGIAFPPGWEAIDPDNADAALAQMAKDNPAFAEIVKDQVGKLSEIIRLLAVDANSPTLAQGFATNANVIVQPVPGSLRFEEFLQANVSQLRSVPGVTTSVEDDAFALPAGRAALIRSRLPIQSPAGTTIAAVTQYLFLTEERGFILSFTTTPESEARYVSVFEAIVRTFRTL